MPTSLFSLNSCVVLTREQSLRVERVAFYPLEFLKDRLMTRQGIAAQQAEDLLGEFRRFMIIAALEGPPLAIPNAAVDDVWHEFLLFTRQYREFCTATVGEYVDHVPHSTATPVPESAMQRFLEYYTRYFGIVPEPWFCQRASTEPLRWSGWVARESTPEIPR
jgi:hypothetical protein